MRLETYQKDALAGSIHLHAEYMQAACPVFELQLLRLHSIDNDAAAPPIHALDGTLLPLP